MASIPPPPDGPTEPLPPAGPAPVVRERVIAPAVDPNLLVTRLERSLDSLRTWLAIISLAAVVAIGLAISALVQADDARNHGGASQSGYASNARVDRLSADVKALRAGGTGGASTAGLAARVAALEAAVKTPRPASGPPDTTGLAARVAALESAAKTTASRPAATDPTQALQQLSTRVDTLAADVAQLKQSAPNP